MVDVTGSFGARRQPDATHWLDETKGLRSGRAQPEACHRVEETITSRTGSQAPRPVTVPMRASSPATASYTVPAAPNTTPDLVQGPGSLPHKTLPTANGTNGQTTSAIDPKACSNDTPTHARHESTSNTETISCATPTETPQAGRQATCKTQQTTLHQTHDPSYIPNNPSSHTTTTTTAETAQPGNNPSEPETASQKKNPASQAHRLSKRKQPKNRTIAYCVHTAK